MNLFTLGWVCLAVGAVILESVALFNSRGGDTLSEHVWAWLGIRDRWWWAHRGEWDYSPDPTPSTPKWTARIGRLVVVLGGVWLIIHFGTGGWI